MNPCSAITPLLVGSLALTLLSAPHQAAPAAARTATVGLCSSPTSSTDALAANLNGRLVAVLKGTRSSMIGFALTDWRTGVTCEYRSRWRTEAASVIKVSLVAARLWQRQRQGRGLTAEEATWSRAAIRWSDNDSATRLFVRIGRAAGLRSFFRAAGMRATWVPANPGPRGGDTLINAADQVELLRALNSRQSPLNTRSRAYVRSLMRTVVGEQRWGVPAGATGQGRIVGNKNGWGPRAAQGWRINSVGFVENQRHHYGMAILSSGNPNMGHGVTTLNQIARAVNDTLR